MQSNTKYCILIAFINFLLITLIYTYLANHSLFDYSKKCSSNDEKHFLDGNRNSKSILSEMKTLSTFQRICKKLQSSKAIKQFKLTSDEINTLQQIVTGLQSSLQNASTGTPTKNNLSQNGQKRKSMNTSDTLDVCEEVNKGRIIGLQIENCTNVKPFKDIITVVLHLAHYSLGNKSIITELLYRLVAKYPNVQIQVAVQQGMFTDNEITIPGKVHVITEINKDATIWNQLIDQVKTPYTFIARDLLFFDEDCRLERLVRAISKLNVSVAGGSTKNEQGYWNMACHQSIFRNYTLIYQSGYHHSKYDCIWCTHITGPFVARTNLLQSNRFDETLKRTILFEDFFFQLQQKSTQVIVCPDSMFNVQADYNTKYIQSDLLPFARKWQINQVQFSHTGLLTFSCKQLGMKCSKPTGIVLPPCCLKILADKVKFVLATCKKYNILCQLNAGTALGALKFNGVLPWELDADVYYLSANMSAMKKLRSIFLADGNTFAHSYSEGGHNFFVYNSGWKIEVWHKDKLDTHVAIQHGRMPTKILYDGVWSNVFRNPALEMRIRYSPEIFRHIQHKYIVGNKHPDSFTKCPKPGKQYCLDQYKTDGLFQFRLPIP